MSLRCLTLVALLLGFLPRAIAAPSPDECQTLLERIRSARLDVERAVTAQNLVVDLGLGRLEIDEGVLIPAVPIADHSMEMVFLGQATFHIEPPDAIEAGQLMLFTEQESLDTGIQQAVLAIGNTGVAETLLDRAPAPELDESRRIEAEELFDAWVSGAERKGFGADAALLMSILGDAAYHGFFSILLRSEDHGTFYYLLDPSELEQVTLGQFVPLELDDREKYLADRRIRRERRHGRSLQTRLEDLGHWDNWLRASLRDEHGQPRPGSSGFEPAHYTLDVTMTPQDERIDGHAAIDLVATETGRRAVALELFADLKPGAVRDGQGHELAWFQSGGDLYVFLTDEVKQGGRVRLEIDYDGVLLHKLESGVFALRDTHGWYPHTGTFDRATYSVTLRYPKRRELLASGRRVDSRIEGGLEVETRELELPAFGFTFEIGDFDIIEEQAGHVALTIGFSKSTMAKDTGVKREVVETVKKALAFYEEKFGAYPLDYLTIATVPRGFSQGFLSFITLSHYLVALPAYSWVVVDEPGEDPRAEQRRETIAHELSHQWWGNKVGWYNYRDQWLSEALADYSAVRFSADQAERRSVYLARHARGWKRSLGRYTRSGLSVESLGPVVLGERLVSSRSDSAYQAVVYDKGSIVFSMLARSLGEEPMTGMLKALADAVAHRAIDTETFIKALSRMSGVNLDSFADQFIYGTGIPEVYYRFDFARGEGDAWVVSGEARQVATANYRYTLFRTETEGWDVRRTRIESVDVSDRALVVPFQIVLAAEVPSESEPKRRGRYTTGRGLGGNMVIQGERTRFSFPIEEEPKDFFLDQRGEVLARFYCESRQPKRMLRYRATELEGEEAEALYKQALGAPLFSEQSQDQVEWDDKELEQRTRFEDARIHLHLARLYLDQQREEEARQAFETAEELLPRRFATGYQDTRAVLESRLDIRSGRFDEAYDRMRRNLRLYFPRLDTDSLADRIRRSKWSAGRTGDGEDYAVLAVAAYETGHEDVARRALEEAEKRGADMSELKERMAADS